MSKQWRSHAEEGTHAAEISAATVPDAEKPEILKAYLDSFKRDVQQYFPVPAGSAPTAFAELTRAILYSNFRRPDALVFWTAMGSGVAANKRRAHVLGE